MNNVFFKNIMIKVTVIILTAGNKKYLNRCLKSVLNQKLLPAEIIIINNQKKKL